MSVFRFGCVTAMAVVISASALAHDIITTNLTYTRDISRIFAQRCVACHSESSSIPLTTYEEARPWAVSIKEQVLGRTMPPWGAVKGFGNLAPDGGLSQEEIMIISAWVIGGAPNGDPQFLLRKAPQTPSSAPWLPLQDGPSVNGRMVLKSEVRVLGIRPITNAVIASARITALLPDGRVAPLVWLFRYDPKYEHNFTFRDQIELPAGTIVQASPPVAFVLQTGAPTGSSRGR